MKREIQETMGDIVLFDAPMSRYTSLQIGGPADAIVFPRHVSDLENLMTTVRKREIPYMVMGKGTNLLVRDRGIRKLVINLSAGFRKISFAGERIHVEAGFLLNDMIGVATKRGLWGLSSLYGIPGTVGGGLAMNAGAWGLDVMERVETITVMNSDGKVWETAKEDLDYAYRRVNLEEGTIVVSGTFLMARGSKNKIEEEIAFYQKKRRETQPLRFPSAGSIFKNPSGHSAGKIIDELGLKGKRVGGAEVSTLHGNFIINAGGATASHVLQLIELIQEHVFKERAITLEAEVRIVGE
ncbi:MAG: UDP-N-acetylmuramate dehydrogenase [Proteobacteria bacterium]|nr:UDP-N-acetylmuramate dehydrogenase [Pseudomonadota bacterium]